MTGDGSFRLFRCRFLQYLIYYQTNSQLKYASNHLISLVHTSLYLLKCHVCILFWSMISWYEWQLRSMYYTLYEPIITTLFLGPMTWLFDITNKDKEQINGTEMNKLELNKNRPGRHSTVDSQMETLCSALRSTKYLLKVMNNIVNIGKLYFTDQN